MRFLVKKSLYISMVKTPLLECEMTNWKPFCPFLTFQAFSTKAVTAPGSSSWASPSLEALGERPLPRDSHFPTRWHGTPNVPCGHLQIILLTRNRFVKDVFLATGGREQDSPVTGMVKSHHEDAEFYHITKVCWWELWGGDCGSPMPLSYRLFLC